MASAMAPNPSPGIEERRSPAHAPDQATGDVGRRRRRHPPAGQLAGQRARVGVPQLPGVRLVERAPHGRARARPAPLRRRCRSRAVGTMPVAASSAARAATDRRQPAEQSDGRERERQPAIAAAGCGRCGAAPAARRAARPRHGPPVDTPDGGGGCRGRRGRRRRCATPAMPPTWSDASTHGDLVAGRVELARPWPDRPGRRR